MKLLREASQVVVSLHLYRSAIPLVRRPQIRSTPFRSTFLGVLRAWAMTSRPRRSARRARSGILLPPASSHPKVFEEAACFSDRVSDIDKLLFQARQANSRPVGVISITRTTKGEIDLPRRPGNRGRGSSRGSGSLNSA